MPVPLAFERVESADGLDRIRVWDRHGAVRVIPSPVNPYAYFDRPVIASSQAVQKRRLSDLEEGTWYYARFPSNRRLRGFVKRYRERGGVVAEDRKPLLDRVVVDAPEWVRGQGRDVAPRVLYFDIEQDSDGRTFPKPDAPIVGIAWAVDDGPIQVRVCKGDAWYAEVVQPFIQAFKDADPDLVVGFHHEGYDLPVLFHAIRKRDRKELQAFTRNGTEPVLDEKKIRGGATRKVVRLAGRVVWDVHPSTEIDMELSGCEDRKLKTVADFLGLPVLEAPDYNIRAMPEADLRAYNENDVHLLREIAARYLGDMLALADHVGAPLERVMNGGSAYAAGVIAARSNRDAGVISDGRNEERNAKWVPIGATYEGANVAIRKRGLFLPVQHRDFASLYPSLIAALGAGPDNSRFVKRRELKKGEDPVPLGLVRQEGDRRVYAVADRELNALFHIEVRGVSRFATGVREMMDARLAIKAQAQAEQDPAKKQELEARAYIMKVLVNSAYGYMGLNAADHGSKAVAILVTAGGRSMLRSLAGAVGDNHVIEMDTDGIYFDRVPSTDQELNARVNLHAAGLGMEPLFRVEADRYDAGYFYKAKNYILRKKGKKTIRGAAFKGTHQCPLFRRVVDEVSDAMLKGGNVATAAKQARELSRYGVRDFVKRVRLTKPARDYSSKKAVALQVAASFRQVHGRDPAVGERMEYVKARSGYVVFAPGSSPDVDMEYYRDVVDDALESLGALNAAKGQVSLFSF